MIILTNPINLYGKKVVADIATRTGNSTADNYSCGLGLAYKVNKLWPDNDSDANMESLFEAQADFDADIVQPDLTEEEYDEDIIAENHAVGVKYNPAVDKTNFDRYYRRLEDIANDYLEKYVGNLVFSIRTHDDGIRSYNSKHRVQNALFNFSGEDGDDFTELADLQLDVNVDDWSTEAKSVARENLPYVVKRLHNMSIYTGIHMLSFVSAYERAKIKSERIRSAGSVKTLKKNAVIEQGVYLCDKQGNITKKVLVQNKNQRASDMFDWITGRSKQYPEYFNDYLNYIHYCKVLNINILDDDMTKYQSDFIDKLIITTVTPNNCYDRNVFNAILSNSTTLTPSDDYNSVLDNTVEAFQQICDSDPILQESILHHDSIKVQSYMNDVKSIYNTYMLMSKGIQVDPSKFYWDSGFLFYADNIVIMSANSLSNPEDAPFENDECIFSELGFVVQVSNLMSLYIMTIPVALANFKNRLIYKDSEYKYVPWRRVGS